MAKVVQSHRLNLGGRPSERCPKLPDLTNVRLVSFLNYECREPNKTLAPRNVFPFFQCPFCLINYLTKNQRGVLKTYIGREGEREESVEHTGVWGQ